MPLVFPWSSPRSAIESDTGSFQLWMLENVRFYVQSLRAESLFSQLSGSLECKPHWLSKPNIWGPDSLAQDLWCGAQARCSLERSCNKNYSPFCWISTQRYGVLLHLNSFLPTHLILVLFYTFICRRSFLVSAELFHWWLFCKQLWFGCAHGVGELRSSYWPSKWRLPSKWRRLRNHK